MLNPEVVNNVAETTEKVVEVAKKAGPKMISVGKAVVISAVTFGIGIITGVAGTKAGAIVKTKIEDRKARKAVENAKDCGND